ncbi:hypothetical protein CJ030_MR2G027160 [Morella rubra]|uniref:Uncharacterized protein n=1 Tax=Morella rubra TaxID=262757 RepID=A0A6A1W8H9_9ROSI|nr:hypothetical protein CJ030_MR4G027167 [Morella rubra]KAB1221521.1 hypothetical protein CJ030_MR2G027160 [Morella rubra]
MHRQSLGSPVSKHHGHGGAKEDTLMAEEEPKHKDDDSASEEERKATRRRRSLSPPPKPEKFVHVIPVVTLLCFLILYLCSHSPSQSDLAPFNGFKLPANSIDSVEIDDLRKGDVLAIRSLRNLQELGKGVVKNNSIGTSIMWSVMTSKPHAAVTGVIMVLKPL